MTTVAERLKTLSSMSGATVAAMLLAIGSSGNTMAERLVSYSGLPTSTVVEHLLAEHSGSYASGTLDVSGSATLSGIAQPIFAGEPVLTSTAAAAIFTSDAIAQAMFAATGGTSISMVAFFELFAPGVKRTLRIGEDIVAISNQQDLFLL